MALQSHYEYQVVTQRRCFTTLFVSRLYKTTTCKQVWLHLNVEITCGHVEFVPETLNKNLYVRCYIKVLQCLIPIVHLEPLTHDCPAKAIKCWNTGKWLAKKETKSFKWNQSRLLTRGKCLPKSAWVRPLTLWSFHGGHSGIICNAQQNEKKGIPLEFRMTRKHPRANT